MVLRGCHDPRDQPALQVRNSERVAALCVPGPKLPFASAAIPQGVILSRDRSTGLLVIRLLPIRTSEPDHRNGSGSTRSVARGEVRNGPSPLVNKEANGDRAADAIYQGASILCPFRARMFFDEACRAPMINGVPSGRWGPQDRRPTSACGLNPPLTKRVVEPRARTSALSACPQKAAPAIIASQVHLSLLFLARCRLVCTER